jgi:hypothetical protein
MVFNNHTTLEEMHAFSQKQKGKYKIPKSSKVDGASNNL